MPHATMVYSNAGDLGMVGNLFPSNAAINHAAQFPVRGHIEPSVWVISGFALH